MKITTLRNVDILPPIFDIIRSKSLKLFGHIKRLSAGLTKLCVEGEVPGGRNRGKPKQMCGDKNNNSVVTN